MDQLIECQCGHAISHHLADGCSGQRMRPCKCPLTESQVLERALSAVRTEYSQLTQSSAQR